MAEERCREICTRFATTVYKFHVNFVFFGDRRRGPRKFGMVFQKKNGQVFFFHSSCSETKKTGKKTEKKNSKTFPFFQKRHNFRAIFHCKFARVLLLLSTNFM